MSTTPRDPVLGSMTAQLRRPRNATPPLNEDQFQQRIIDLCKYRHLLVFHDKDSRKNERGFPDLVIVGNRTIFRELKTDAGALRPDQKVWLERLHASGEDARIWRPKHWMVITQEISELAR